jgi:SP family sugar:H+ symporter-like MFS transporter
VASYFLLDRFGRKSSLVFGLITSFVSLSIISAGYYIKDNHPYATTLILVFCFIFSINFGLTLGPAIWIYIADIAEPAIISLSMIIGWICGSFALVLFPILTKVYLNDNPAHIIVFTAALTFLALAIVYCLGIETQGKTEKEIKDEFHRIASCCRKEDETTEA